MVTRDIIARRVTLPNRTCRDTPENNKPNSPQATQTKENTSMNRWKPNATVATVIERTNSHHEKEYLLVHERRNGQTVYNQPAGHLDEGESIIHAAKRETQEETGWEVNITSLIGIYRFIAPNGITYLRHAFSATPIKHHPTQILDEGIIEAVWLSYEDIIKKEHTMRSIMVKKTIDDYRQGYNYPLTLFKE
jgi:ADP-ribose pyrophosphatase YjhB (NUDIX family)